MKHLEKGFSLLEMLVSVLIFSLIAIGIYYFFDTGKWMYLHSEKRANMQENGRLAMEAMEREMRLIGFGVPTGGSVGGNLSWNPAVFSGDDNSIVFRGDVDNYNSLSTASIASGASSISVENPEYACPFDGIPILIVERGRNWQSTTCSGRTSTAINISPGATQAFAIQDVEIFASPLHVMYRLTPDTNGDSICDEATQTKPNYDNCIIERAEERYLTPPVTDPMVNATWQTFATNISEFRLRYFRKTNAGPVALSVPLGILTSAVDVIQIDITATDRADKVGEYQSSNFMTQVLVRKHRY
jgi:prepilin-type N-terminal cleavage/methylation domain-containing protein